MNRIPTILLLLIVILCVGLKQPLRLNEPKWVSLFNGKNLDGWTMKIVGFPLGENFGNTFRVENGILSVRYDQYKTFDGRFGALYYNKSFRNYRLKVEYRFVGELTPGVSILGLSR